VKDEAGNDDGGDSDDMSTADACRKQLEWVQFDDTLEKVTSQTVSQALKDIRAEVKDSKQEVKI